MSCRNFRNIKAWQLAKTLTLEIYKYTKSFPADEKFGIISQIRRSAASVAANISEGALRNSNKEFLHFLYISRASLAETEFFIEISENLKYLNQEDFKTLDQIRTECSKTLNGLIKSVRNNLES